MDTGPLIAAVEVDDIEVISQSAGAGEALDAEEGDAPQKTEVPAFLLETLQVDKEDGESLEIHTAEIL